MNRREFLRLGGAGLAGAALLGSGTLAGCGGGSSGSGGGLTVASWDIASDALRNTIPLFKKKRPGTDVSMQSITIDYQQLVPRLQAGSGYSPDRPLRWVEARRWATNEAVLVPLELVAASPEFDPDHSPGALAREVLGSKRDLERFAGGPVRVLAWREGTPLGADGRADGALRDAGYELLLANHAVQRIR